MANRLDFNRTGLLRLGNNGFEMVGELPLWLPRGVPGLRPPLLRLVAEEEDVLGLATKVELLAIDHAIAGGAVLGPSLNILCRGVGDRFPDLGEQAGLVQGVLKAHAADDVEGLLASAEGFGVAGPISGVEQSLGLLELTGLHQAHRFEDDRVPGGEGCGDGGRFGGKARGERGGECQDQAARKEKVGFHLQALVRERQGTGETLY